MQNQNYRPETLANLAHALINRADRNLYKSDTFKLCLSVVTRMIADELVPEYRKDEILTEEELVECIKTYVQDAVKPYIGSHNGCLSWHDTRWIIFSLLFGVDTADSLLDNERNVDIEVTYENGVWSLEIPGMKKSVNGQFYDCRWDDLLCETVRQE